MKIECPSCGNPIPGDDIDIHAGRALCRPCGEVVLLDDPGARRLADELAVRPDDAAEALATSPAFRPADLKLKEAQDGDATVLTIAPTRWAALPILGFAAVWDAFLVFWYSMALGPAKGGGFGGVMLWFPLIHVAAGIYVTYMGLLKLLNSTHIRLGPERFEVKQGPIPGRRVDESTTSILRFESATRAPTFKPKNGPGTPHAIVKLLTTDGRAIDLPIELPGPEHAAHLAHRLNQLVGAQREPDGYRGTLGARRAAAAAKALSGRTL